MYIYRIFIILLFASSLHAQDDVATTIHVLSDNPTIILETITAIESRLVNAGYDINIEDGDSASVFRISTLLETGSTTDSILYYSQMESNVLEFGIALRQDDRIIRLLYKDLESVDGLIMNVANNPSAIFLSKDPQLLDKQLDNLKLRIAALSNPKYQDLAFCWSPQLVHIAQKDESYTAHILYAFDGASDYGINESNIQTAEIKRSNYGEEVHFNFSPDTHDSWLSITHRAGQDNARAVLIMLNNKVINAPRIPSGIHFGKGIISGIRNRDRAIALVRQIRIGRLPVEVQVLSTIKLNAIED